jgi:hypothetical protein
MLPLQSYQRIRGVRASCPLLNKFSCPLAETGLDITLPRESDIPADMKKKGHFQLVDSMLWGYPSIFFAIFDQKSKHSGQTGVE